MYTSKHRAKDRLWHLKQELLRGQKYKVKVKNTQAGNTELWSQVGKVSSCCHAPGTEPERALLPALPSLPVSHCRLEHGLEVGVCITFLRYLTVAHIVQGAEAPATGLLDSSLDIHEAVKSSLGLSSFF